MISTAFRIQILKVLELSLAYKKKKCVLNLLYCPEKKLVKIFLEKLLLGIDLAMVEGKSVKHAGDYNINHFANHDRNLLQFVISPYDLKPSNINTATRMTNSSLTLIHYIITDDNETGTVADKILKTDPCATITVLKSVILKSKTTKKNFLTKILFSHSVPKFY